MQNTDNSVAASTMAEDIKRDVASRLELPLKGVSAVIDLLDEGATVPFISRYRKERTGSMDEVGVRSVESMLKTVRELYARREFISNAIRESGNLTPEISNRLNQASAMTELEDIYAPFKPKKRTRATMAREKGLEPLARIIMSGRGNDCERAAAGFVGKNGVADTDEALRGASDIIAEWASESPRLRNMTRNAYRRGGSLSATVAKDKDAELAGSPFAQYAGFSQSVRRMASHQYLAMRRAEKEGLLKVKYQLDESRGSLEDSLIDNYIPRQAGGDSVELIADAVADASKRLIRPAVETEISASLKEEADRVAIDIFADNLRQLLLAPPLRGKRVLAIDPGYRTGCKVVALDEQGALLDTAVIYPAAPRNDVAGATDILSRMIRKHRLDVVSLGNGTASRETERFLKQSALLPQESIYVVSEDGASVYSASDVARAEFPDHDVTVRGAVSIGRRLIDPLAELVKIDPKSIGVGQYQHDVDQTRLKGALDYTVMSCVNAVGVDVNTASTSLLQYVSGIGPALAANIVAYRTANGPFRSRAELKKVPRLGENALEQSSGLLRVDDGKEPLDNTGIHPESYALVKKMARSIGAEVAELPANSELLSKIDLDRLAAEGVGGLETMRDIVAELRKPGRDPRTDGNTDAFIPGVDSFEQLHTGMTLPGKVANITAFGAFIDLGIK
ncbi:MAG: RNA-binding transcriptional accessory protein, partial [Muribaculaceae bacterium]|nr:RNA-binding transcriptional accessory protein [Muribaculaceae bacterium]